MRETNFIGQALVMSVLLAVTLYFGFEVLTASSNPYAW